MNVKKNIKKIQRLIIAFMTEKRIVRLNKFISESGFCSRREADRFIELGFVSINGEKGKLGDQVEDGDKVIVNGSLIRPKNKKNFSILAYNKPEGVICTTEKGVKDNILQHVRFSERIFPIGRLDKDSRGLIFLTNNGDIVNKILRAGNKHEKEYLVTVTKPITEDFLIGMASGVPIMGERTKKCFIRKTNPFSFKIILVQGLNRQIRRMCEYFNYEVKKIDRIRIMNITVKGLALGDYRELNSEEKSKLLESIADSSSERKKKSRS